MANTFVNPTQVVQTALALLRDDLILAATVNRDFEAEYGGGLGSTVNVRVPATLKARRRQLGATTAVVTDNLAETTVPVKLTDMVYSAVPVTDEDLTLNIQDFARQVLAPQITAIVEDLENSVATTMLSLTETTTLAYSAANPIPTFTQARKLLRDMGVPAAGLYAAVGTGVYAELLEAKAIVDASESGSSAALRDAVAGTVRGFQTLESNRLGDHDIVFYNRDSFTLAVRAPIVPDGVAYGESRSEGGFALRWIRDYDSTVLADRSIVSTLTGAQPMQLPRLNPDGTRTLVTPAIRVDTSTNPPA